MRYLLTVVLAMLSISFSDISASSAEGMSGEAFKKLVIGNTLYRESSSGRTRVYFFHDAKRLTYDAGSIPPYETRWSVTKGGKFCRYNQHNEQSCYSNFRREGNNLHGENNVGSPRLFILEKGDREVLAHPKIDGILNKPPKTVPRVSKTPKATDTGAEAKLKKLKRFLEKELITIDEYRNQQRKILDRL
jgi:hypothetical protein